ncbi:MAG: large conductance mechanosensitive channel protein MscL [Alphaproteobacteria bacterium]|nr:large conductance mechanosensitive channel protein MscL [Alphaproteobacteria bacterium]
MKTKLLSEFKTFISKGSAVDMAVGIIVGSVMTSVVNSLVKDIIMPPIGMLIGGIDFSQWFYVIGGGEPGVHYATMEAATAAGATTLNLGTFLNTVISFIITMFAIFIFVKIVNSARAKAPVTTRACPYCKQSISKMATKCPYCCSDVETEEVEAAGESDLGRGIKNLTSRVKGVATKAIKKSK